MYAWDNIAESAKIIANRRHPVTIEQNIINRRGLCFRKMALPLYGSGKTDRKLVQGSQHQTGAIVVDPIAKSGQPDTTGWYAASLMIFRNGWNVRPNTIFEHAERKRRIQCLPDRNQFEGLRPLCNPPALHRLRTGHYSGRH